MNKRFCSGKKICKVRRLRLSLDVFQPIFRDQVFRILNEVIAQKTWEVILFKTGYMNGSGYMNDIFKVRNTEKLEKNTT